jgi:drug/metabolite transporter (DMT)-like permease
MLGIELDFKSAFDLRQLFQRNTLMVLHQFYYFIMQFVVSLPTINTILLSGPLFVFILDYFMNGVTITQRQLASIATGICGVAITINADLILPLIDPTYTPRSDFENYIVDDPIMRIGLSSIAILFNICWAYSIVGQKKISHVPGIKISYHLGLEFIVVAGLLLCFKPAEAIKEEVFLGATIYSGAIMGFCQILFMSALNLSKNTGVLSMLILLYTVTAYLVSFFRYNEPINVLALMGLALMGCGLAATILAKKT